MSPDPGLHAASEWLLRKWEEKKWLEPGWLKKVNDEWSKDGEGRAKRLQEIKSSMTKEKEKAPSQWYVNTEGQTMVVLPGPMEFQIGSPTTELGRIGGAAGQNEKPVKRSIGRSFAIAKNHVTVEEFLRFREAHNYSKQNSPTPKHPINEVTWYDAVAYCNWLSEREGLTPVYEPNKANEYGEGMRLKANHLELDGYRLPTDSEWEYACRAKTVTSRYFGETEELLGHYCWYTKNSLDRFMLEAGSLKPNDYGLFDMQGNALQWCENKALLYKPGADEEDSDDNKSVVDKNSRELRGSSFYYRASNARSAYLYSGVPASRYYYIGFRPARTFIP